MSYLLNNTAAIVLAAGRGTRMNARSKNKVVFKLRGKPMIEYTLNNLTQAGVGQIIAVVGFAKESVQAVLKNRVDYAFQDNPKGTGHALKCALPHLRADIDTVMMVSGDDSAFYPPALYLQMTKQLNQNDCDLLVLTIHKDDPSGLGRIVRNAQGKIIKIVEEKIATQTEKKIQEINTGFYCFKRQFLEDYLPLITKNPVSQEYYATDLVEIALSQGKRVQAYFMQDGSVWHGVNTRRDYSQAQRKLTNG